MNKILIVCAAAALAAGCAPGQGLQGMTAEQLTAAAKAKDANVACTKATTRFFGEVITTYVNLDKGVLQHGGISVDKDCAVNVINSPGK